LQIHIGERKEGGKKVVRPSTLLRLAAIAAVVVTSSIYAAVPALAQPANDLITSPTVIPALPFSDGPVDTTTATTAPDDPDCVGNGPTVWYRFTPSSDVQVSLDTRDSSYDTTLSAYTGSPGNLVQIACNDDFFGLQSKINFAATGGTTYYVMVGAYASGPGGTLFLHADVAQPPYDIGLTVSRTGSVRPKVGVATVRGTVSCNTEGSYEVSGNLTQRIGRLIVSGRFLTSGDCTPPAVEWEASVEPAEGLFVAGRATVGYASAFGCSVENCDFAETGPISVTLRGGA
jgi:hypothetical protein